MQQDIFALAIAALAAAWLARTLARRLVAPPCRPPAAPGAGDGFVPLDALARPSAKAAGRGPPGEPPAHTQ